MYDLTAWDEAGKAMNQAVRAAGLRIIAVGVPREEIYKDRIQHKLTVEELWVEDLEKKSFAEVVSKNGVAEEEPRIYEPIEVPASIG